MVIQATKVIPAGRTLIFTRRFRAPRLLVWRTFEDPYLLAQWWGPEGFTCPDVRLDFRVGGEWRTVIRSPDGVEIPSAYVFTEIVKPERIVYRSAPPDSGFWNGNPPPAYRSVIAFIEYEGGTELVMRSEFDTELEALDAMKRGFAAGTSQSHSKLERLLEQQLQGN